MTALALLVAPGSTPSSVTSTLDMVAIARRHPAAADCRLDLLSASGGEIALAPALRLQTTALPERLDDYAAILISGFFAADIADLVRQLAAVWQPAIQRLAALPADRLVAASCYGSFVLAESGRLDGRPATTPWWLADAFHQRYPQVRLDADQALVDAGPAITAGAMTAHVDLSLHVLRRLFGAPLAREVGGIMLIDGARRSQRPFKSLPQRFADPLVDAAAGWLGRHASQDVSTQELAAALAVSYRTLHRRFVAAAGMPPLAYLQALRIEHARELLETTRDSIERIVEAVGYRDSSAFRRLFARQLGLSPAEYRQRFCHPEPTFPETD